MNQLDLRLAEVTRVILAKHDLTPLDTDDKLSEALEHAIETEVHTMGSWDLLQAAMANPTHILDAEPFANQPISARWVLREAIRHYLIDAAGMRLSYLGDAYIEDLRGKPKPHQEYDDDCDDG